MIVDSVLAIRKGLTHSETPKTVVESKEEFVTGSERKEEQPVTINGVPLLNFAYGAVF